MSVDSVQQLRAASHALQQLLRAWKIHKRTRVLAAVPSISSSRRVYGELHEKADRLETGGAGKELSTKSEIQSF